MELQLPALLRPTGEMDREDFSDYEESEQSDLTGHDGMSDYEEIEQKVLAGRFQCALCYGQKTQFDTKWSLSSNGSKCQHDFCTQCIQGTITWDRHNPRCPFDNAPINARDVCGVMTKAQFVSWEKDRLARSTGNLPCSSPDCVGGVQAVLAQLPVRRTCDRCATHHCGRRQCGAPWMEGHRCPDIVAAEAAAAAAAVAAEQAAARTSWLQNRLLPRQQFAQGIANAPNFQTCPRCGVMVERDGGCNMMRHCEGGCGAEWCWICQRVGTCSDFMCAAKVGNTPHTVEAHNTTCSTSGGAASSERASCAVQTSNGGLEVDAALPTTEVRITLHNGQRRQLTANESHTVGDLCDFCSLLAGGISMDILCAYPPQVIADKNMTLRTAGILNSSLRARPSS